MIKTIPYWLYKTGYSGFPASDYDAARKTISVELPEYKKPRFPKAWKKSGNCYHVRNGVNVYFWGSGLSESFTVEVLYNNYRISKTTTFHPNLRVREQVMEFVNSL